MKIKILIAVMVKGHMDSLTSSLVEKGYSLSPSIENNKYMADRSKDDASLVLLFDISKNNTSYEKIINEFDKIIKEKQIKYYCLFIQGPDCSRINGSNFKLSFDEETQKMFDNWQRLKVLK